MLGAVLGDIIGSAYAGQGVRSKDFPLKTPKTRYTGDTVMTLAVARWLLEDPQFTGNWLVHCMQKMRRGNLRAGYDAHLKNWLMAKEPKPYMDMRDGHVAARISPVGLYAPTLEEAGLTARDMAKLTNCHPEAVRGAMAVAECVFLNRNRTPQRSSLTKAKEAIRERITSEYGYDLSRSLEEIRIEPLSVATGMEKDPDIAEHAAKAITLNCYCVERAITVVLESDTLEDCVRNAVYAGGEPGVIAAIACSIFAANRECWDERLMAQFEKYLPHDLQNIMEEFEKMVFPTKPTPNSFKVTDNIYAGEYPRDRDEDKSVNKMKQFERFGISHFIDLTEKGELASYKEFLGAGMSHQRFPIPDVSVPTSTEDVRKLIWEIKRYIEAIPDIKIYIHCWGGVGRTGTIVGCLLADMMGYDYDQTITTLRQLFEDCPKSAYRITPETQEQCQFIARYIDERNQHGNNMTRKA